jgi:hypothetical protein
MTKLKLRECRKCKVETWHRVKRKQFKPHSHTKGGGGTKYVMEHCCRCKIRWYDGKLKGQRIEEKKQKHISF